MNRVFKYPLPVQGTVDILMPYGARILTIGAQGEDMFVWALVNPDLELEHQTHRFHIVGTGHPCPFSAHKHLETVIVGQFVWHVFEGSVD
jgi:hypothetical protein